MCVLQLPHPFYPTQRGRKSSPKSPIHLKHNGTPQRFSSRFHVCPTHIPPQGRMEGQGVPCPAGSAATPICHQNSPSSIHLSKSLFNLENKYLQKSQKPQNKMNVVATNKKVVCPWGKTTSLKNLLKFKPQWI